MAFETKNDLGRLSVSDDLIADIIMKDMEAPSLKGRVWPATRHGRKIGDLPRVIDSEFGSNIDLDLHDDGTSFDIGFSVIVKFGVSIREVTSDLAGKLRDDICAQTGLRPAAVTIYIAGVKSKKIARRNTKVVFDDEGDVKRN